MSGINAQLGFAKETTSGTYETPTEFLPFVDENIKHNIDRIESQAIRAGRRTKHTWRPGGRASSGSFNVEVAPKGILTLLHQLIGGTPVTTDITDVGTNGTHQHVFTPGDLPGTFTLQVGRPDVGGTVHPFSYLGAAITGGEFSISADELLMLKVDVHAQDETTGESLATATYPTPFIPFAYTEGSLTVAGSAVCVKDWKLSFGNALATGRRFVCAADAGKEKAAIEAGERELGGSFTADFEDLTLYNRYINGDEAELEMTFTAPTGESLVFNLNVRYDGETTEVGGRDLLEQSMTYEAVSATSDADALTLTVINNDTSV